MGDQDISVSYISFDSCLIDIRLVSLAIVGLTHGCNGKYDLCPEDNFIEIRGIVTIVVYLLHVVECPDWVVEETGMLIQLCNWQIVC